MSGIERLVINYDGSTYTLSGFDSEGNRLAADQLEFNEDISVNDIRVQIVPQAEANQEGSFDHLVLRVLNADLINDDLVTVEFGRYLSLSEIESLQPTMGAELALAELVTVLQTALPSEVDASADMASGADGSGAVEVAGDETEAWVQGSAGDETLDGSSGDDLFYGSTGNDTLLGGEGDDQYYFNRGDGADTIREASGSDTIVFGEGITASDIVVSVELYSSYNSHSSYDHIVLNVLSNGQPTDDQITILYSKGAVEYQVEKLVFGDGSALSLAGLMAEQGVEYKGNPGSNSLIGIAELDGVYLAGQGDDFLYGKTGDDRYHFNRGDGADTIVEIGGNDRVMMGEGISLADVKATFSGNHLAIQLYESGEITNDSLMVRDALLGDSRTLETIEFVDGTSTTITQLLQSVATIEGTAGDDTLTGDIDTADMIYGFSGHDVLSGRGGEDQLYGGAGDDSLAGGSGADTLAGGLGSDTLFGGMGDDQYLFSRGDGADTIQEANGNDTIVFGEGINLSDIHIQVLPYNGVNSHSTLDSLVIQVLNAGEISGDQLTVITGRGLEVNKVENLRFSDGLEITLAELMAEQGVEYLGNRNSNVLTGIDDLSGVYQAGQGDDVLYGKTGDDHYHFNRGDGADTVIDAGGEDRIIMGEGISRDDVALIESGNNFILQLYANGQLTEDRLTLTKAVNGEGPAIEVIDFADGSGVWASDLLDSAHSIDGTAGNDRLVGEEGKADIIRGYAGDDMLLGAGGDDQLHGGEGNDTLRGGAGNDQYYFSRGDGVDTIWDTGGYEALMFDEGISASDLQVSVQLYQGNNSHSLYDHIVLKLMDNGQPTDDQITLMYSKGAEHHQVESLLFNDGSELMLAELMASQGVEYLGNQNSNSLIGIDEIDGVYQAGQGDDVLYGKTGDDRYYFNRGDGADRIIEIGGSDRIMMGEGISQSDVKVSGSGRDLLIQLYSDGELSDDKLTVQDALQGPDRTIEFIEFTDGSSQSVMALLQSTLELEGTASNDTLKGATNAADVIRGYAGNDTLIGGGGEDQLFGGAGDDSLSGGSVTDILVGGEGSDTLYGGEGDDQYHFSRGDGSDTIQEADGNDTIAFGEGIGLSDIRVQVLPYNGVNSHSTLDSLVIQVLNAGQVSGDQITVTTGRGLTVNQIENLSFSDGTEIALAELMYEQGVEYLGNQNSNVLTGIAELNGVYQAGQGDDVLYGQIGDDSYHFNRGDGADTIIDAGGADRIVMGEGIARDDVAFIESGNHLIVQLYSGGELSQDRLTLANVLSGGDEVIETIDFVDGSSLAISNYLKPEPSLEGTAGDDELHGLDSAAEVIRGHAGNDSLYGHGAEDTLYGGAGDDALFGGSDADTLVGGEGNDTLHGQGGDDRYHFSRGDGVDSITDTGGIDRIVMGEQIGLADVEVIVSGDDIIVQLYAEGTLSGDELTIVQAAGNDAQAVEFIDFADGSSLQVAELINAAQVIEGTDANDNLLAVAGSAAIILGGAGDDNLTGKDGDDQLYGDQGSDAMRGGEGDDRYYFSRGDGTDTIWETSGNDAIVFGEGIIASDLQIAVGLYRGNNSHSSYDNIILNLLDNGQPTGDQITILYSKGTVNHQVENLVFSDGSTVTLANLMAEQGVEYLGTQEANSLTGIDALDGRYRAALGDDTLYGQSGDDRYYFDRGDGKDTIVEIGGYDRLVLGEGITPDDIAVSAEQNNLTIQIYSDGESSSDALTIKDALVDASRGLEAVEFADGSSLTMTELLEKPLTIEGSANDDSLWASSDRAVILHGYAGDDTLSGQGGDDQLHGGAGTDSLTGGSGMNILAGGTGSDTLNGGEDNDQYLFNRGDGADVLWEVGGNDTIAFGEGIEASDLWLSVSLTAISNSSTSNDNIILNVLDGGQPTGDQITIQYSKDDVRYQVENIAFSDGSKLALAELMAQQDVEYLGNEYGNSLTGIAERNGVYKAGQGTDTLYGQTGDDRYHFNRGDGRDTIIDLGGNDRIVMGEGITRQDVEGTEYDNDIKIWVYTDGEQVGDLLTIKGALKDEGSQMLELIEFADGSTVTIRELMGWPALLEGTDGNDTLVGADNTADTLRGFAGNDTLSGKGGDDQLFGGTGDDQYHFSRGDGVDVIQEDRGNDALIFGEGITASDLRLSITLYSGSTSHTNDHLVIDVLDNGQPTDDQITLQYSKLDERYQIETFVFSDGSETTLAELLADQGVEYHGTAYNDMLIGLAEVDGVYKGWQGNDSLYGQSGDDQYQYNLGDGADTIIETGGYDRIVMGEGISQSDVKVTQDIHNLNIEVYAQSGSRVGLLTVENALAGRNQGVEAIDFVDGSSLSLIELLESARTIEGSDYSDELFGEGWKDDIIIGHGGNDVLAGAGGDDEYHFSRGDDADILVETSGSDSLIFGDGINATDVKLVSSGDNLVVQLWDGDVLSGDSITLYGARTDESRQVETFEFVDDTTISLVTLIAQSEDPLL